jgi:hypothetical protein
MIALPRHVDDTWTVARTGRRIVSLLTACEKKRDGKRYPATGKVATGRFRGRSRPQAARRSQSHRLQLPVNIGRRRDRRKGPEKRESGHFLKRDVRTLESFLWPSDSRITSYIHNAVFYDDQECAPCRCHLQACRGSWEGFRPCLGHLPRGPLLQERDHGCAIDPFRQLCQAGRAGACRID